MCNRILKHQHLLECSWLDDIWDNVVHFSKFSSKSALIEFLNTDIGVLIESQKLK